MTGLSYNLMPQDDEPVIASGVEASDDLPDVETPQLVATEEQALHLLRDAWNFDEEKNGGIRPENPKYLSREEVAALYNDYSPRVFGYLLSLGVHEEEAKEVAQEVFLQLILWLDRGGQIEKPQGWIIGVAQKLALKLYRSNVRRSTNEMEADQAIAVDRVDPAPNQEERLLKLERMRALRRALRREREQNRECFLMRAQGFRYKDIGKAMNISEQRAALIVKHVALRLAVICG